MALHDVIDQSTTLGKYRLLAELGRGGMAQVYLAVASGPAGFHKLLVVKQIDPELAEDPDFVAMFLDEARLAARLNHPNVVQTYEVGQEGNRYYIAMEYLEGQPFSSVLGRLARTRDVMPLGMQIRVVAEALAGLHYAHELNDFDGTPLNVVHRDVSPHNIFVTYSGQVKVVDFGIAKACTSSVRTQTGVMKGKVGYMGPEQTRGEPLDRRADIFAIGVILWEIATGRRLFAGEAEFVVMQRVCNDEIPHPSTVCAAVHPELEAIILRAMAPRPDDRYATAAELADALERLLADLGERGTTRELGALVAEHFAERRARIDAIVEAELAGTGPASIAELPRLPLAASSQTSLVRPGAGADPDGVPTRTVPMASEARAEADSVVTRAMPQAVDSPSALQPAPGEQGEPWQADPAPMGERVPARHSSSRPGRVAVVVLVAAVLAGMAAAAVVHWSGSTSADSAPSSSPSAAAVRLRIESNPAGARVLRDGALLGTTPIEVEVAEPQRPGQYVLELAGYEADVLRPAPLSGDHTIRTELRPVAANPGADGSAAAGTSATTGGAPIATAPPAAVPRATGGPGLAPPPPPTGTLGIRTTR